MLTFGCAYYPDYLPGQSLCRTGRGEIKSVDWRDSIKINLERMRNCKISTIRMGEFSWASVEPARNRFDFSRFEYTLEEARARKIDVIFCTPTATPPKWLVDEMPEILPVTRDGKRIPFGTRRHYDVHNERYRGESRRITAAYAEALGQHQALVGWQIDNELGCHGSVNVFTDAARRGFHRWLRARYHDDIEQLNEDWFCGFWSQRYTNFEQIELPFSSWADQNPHLELDFRRFSNEQHRAFQKEQVDILKSLSRGRFITHNLMTLFTDLCPWSASADLDTVGFDHYQMDEQPHPLTSYWQFALMRSLKKKPFLVLEQQPVQVNWHSVNERFAYSWLFLWTMQAAVLGAQSVFYFSWQRFVGGAEQYHDGILSHDVRIAETWQERAIKSISRLVEELKERFSLDQMPEPERQVVCVYDSESVWSHEITAQSNIYSTRREIDFATSLCSSNGLGLSFSKSICDALAGPDRPELLLLPGYAFELLEAEKAAIASFLAVGGKILSLPRTAMKRRNNQMSQQPLSFFDSTELCLPDFGALLGGERDIFSAGSGGCTGELQFEGELWSERIQIAGNWDVLAQFDSGPYKGCPAVISRTVEHGKFIHVATCPPTSPAFFSWILSALHMVPAVTAPDRLQLVPLQHDGRRFLAALNFADEQLSLEIEHSGSGVSAALGQLEQLTLDRISAGEAKILVPPRSFVFLER